MIDRERIAVFVEEYRTQLVIVLAVFLIILTSFVLVSVVSGSSRRNTRIQEEQAAEKAAVYPDELWFPDEPFPLPGIQEFRKTPPVWSADDVKLWYNRPDPELLDGIRETARRQIEDLLESVP